MEWQQLMVDGCGRVLEILEPAFEGLTPEDLDWQPHPECNSMGWITWHLTRGQDSQIASLMGKKQLWIVDRWHDKFERPADPKDTGFGHTPEQVVAFKSPDPDVLLDYYRAVLEQTKGYLGTLSLADLDKELNEPRYKPPPTVGVRLVSIMADCLEHAGEVGYLRGLMKGKGWLDA
ncbi:MAG: DinB family protein [Chloroflexi bacterium]|nr:DinB family protein [Chloroflexota bacterium]